MAAFEDRGRPQPPPIARGLAAGVLADVITLVFVLALSIVVSRFLGATGRGLYFLTILVPTMAAYIGDTGVSAAAVVFASRRDSMVRGLHGIALGTSALTGILGAAVLLGFRSWWESHILVGLDTPLILIAAAGIIPVTYAQIASALLVGSGGVTTLAARRIQATGATLVLTTAVVWITDGSSQWACGVWLATTAAFAGALALDITRRGISPRMPTKYELRSVYGFSGRTYPGTLAHHAFLRIDVLFVSSQLGPAAVGIYSLASMLAERISTLAAALYNATAPHIGGARVAEAEAITARVIRMLLVILAAATVALALAAEPMITIVYGDEFADAAVPFVLLLPGTAALTVWYVLGFYILSSLRLPALASAVQVSGLIFSLPLYYVAVSRFDMIGAAVASTATYVFVLAAGLLILIRRRLFDARLLVLKRRDVRDIADSMRNVSRFVRRGHHRANKV